MGKDSAKSTLTVWEDFRCPACKPFEEAYRKTIHELTDKGQLKVEYHLATLIDGNMGGSGSLRAANAAACAQDAGKFTAVPRRAVHEPAAGDGRRVQQERQADRARGQGGRARHATFKSCVDDGKHDSWVAEVEQGLPGRRVLQGTPTVLLDGKNIFQDQTLTPAKLKKMVEEANKGLTAPLGGCTSGVLLWSRSRAGCLGHRPAR